MIDYLTKDIKKPNMEDSTYNIWDAENSIIMMWLVNSLADEVSVNYLYYSTAKELWDNVLQLYLNLGINPIYIS